ncbi:MAG: hypothetical protein KGS00_06095 [Alphaproteobacteria bacterium]|nr:hypothetical protein [Alphaproteobacteria bacterium]
MAIERRIMTEERFLERLSVYGADLSRWPQDEREAARRCLEAGSHRLRDLWESEGMFDALLQEATCPPASEALVRRVSGSFRAPAQRRSGSLLSRSGGWRTGGAIAASLLFGLIAGGLLEARIIETGNHEEEEDLFALSDAAGVSVLLTALGETER